MESKPELILFVYTGDRKNSGTNNKVKIRLYNDDGKTSKAIALNKFFTDDLEKDKVDTYKINKEDVTDFDYDVKIVRVEVWKNSFLGIISDDWFVHKIVVENTGTNLRFVFPCFRWIKSSRVNIMQFDTSLPQYEKFVEQRRNELERKKKDYEYAQIVPSGPVQIKKLPPDEEFPFSYKWDIYSTTAAITTAAKIEAIFSNEYETIQDIKDTFNNDQFVTPRYLDTWHLDVNFGRQRIAGLNPTLIEVVTQIPAKFPVTDAKLGALLGGLTIDAAISQKRLFITDHQLLEGVPTLEGLVVCKPMGLFFLDDNKNLMPVAIQLYQQPDDNNPIFTPEDDPMLWSLVKLWYNNTDANMHQGLAHLGFTHLLMEGFCVATNRNLSPSHPILKILAPHFLYLLNINRNALVSLLAPGAWVDQNMNIGEKGFKYIIKKGFDDWKLEVHGLLPENLKSRGFDEADLLPGYLYGHDGMMLYNCIKQYVTDYVSLYYLSDDVLKEDREVQQWAAELVKERNNSKGGCGYLGVPGNGQLTFREDLVKIVTCIIYTCSVTHAAVNFPQYDEYAFAPNYPSVLKGTPPTSTTAMITEKDLVAVLPNQERMLDMMTIATVLSNKGTNSLGDFEVQYIFDPKALKLVAKFRENLEAISKTIQERNSKALQPYDYLDPVNVPNAISI